MNTRVLEMRAVLCVILFVDIVQPAWAVKQVNWQDLIDPVAADFDDPLPRSAPPS